MSSTHTTTARHDSSGNVLLRAVTVCLVAAALAAGCSSAQVGPLTSPSGTLGVSDPRVAGALVTSCYECHSNQSVAPWNAKLAPSYWFAGSARESLNFSDWTAYDAKRRSEELTAIAKTVSSGEMPPWDYELFHPSGAMSVDDKAAVVQWASSQAVAPAH